MRSVGTHAVLILNLLIPGAGMIIQGREWLGFCLALVFGVCGNIVLAGTLVAPDALPIPIVVLAAALCLFAWSLAQFLFRRQALLVRHLQHESIVDLPIEAPSERVADHL